MKIEFLLEAREELIQAATFYEAKESSLGIQFQNEVAHVLEHVVSDPYLWRERPGG